MSLLRFAVVGALIASIAALAGRALPTNAQPRTTLDVGRAYSLVDYGSPASARYLLEQPIAFNNTGEIAGGASDNVKLGDTCMLFEGSRFRNISSQDSITSCNVNGMNDANRTSGDVLVVGSAVSEYSQTENKAFLSTVAPNPNVARLTLFTDDSSSLTGVNANGKAIGIGSYTPLSGFESQTPPFVVTPPSDAFRVLQPSCITIRAGCASIDTEANTQTRACPFGGCEITADGTLLLTDLFSGKSEVIAASGSTQDVALGPHVNEFPGDTGPIINDAKQILFSTTTKVAGTAATATKLYQFGSGKITTVPALAGSSCSQYIPISFNNLGSVLGYTRGCSRSADTYFVYDPKTGTRALSASLPSADTVYPLGINDEEQILVAVSVDPNGLHWGVLVPATQASEIPAKAVAYIGRFRASHASVARTMPRHATGARRLRKPRPMPLRVRAAAAGAQRYTVVDDGAPSSRYTLQSPVAFNNTGQIVGVAKDAEKPYKQTCELFDGARYRDISAAAEINQCTINSISDENPATGTLAVVGDVLTEYTLDSFTDIKGLLSTVAPKSGFVGTTTFDGNDYSDLFGVNVSGEAVGTAAYFPYTGFFFTPTFSLAAGAQHLTLLQPVCVAAQAGCGLPYANGCSFGGCIITADGTLLLQDAYTQTYELLERSGAFHDFTVPLAYAITDLPIVNNAKDVLYAIGTTTGGTFSITPELFTVATGRVTSVPQIPGNSCTEYYPVSFNNSGHVLGYTAGCPKNDQTYFTYDSKNGTRDLGAELPGGYPFIDPIGINDRDEILVALTDAAGAAHWGFLKPAHATKSVTRALADARGSHR